MVECLLATESFKVCLPRPTLADVVRAAIHRPEKAVSVMAVDPEPTPAARLPHLSTNMGRNVARWLLMDLHAFC